MKTDLCEPYKSLTIYKVFRKISEDSNQDQKYIFVGHIEDKIIKDIFRLGIPASLSMIIMSMGLILFNWILGSSDAVAAYQTAGRIEHLFFLPIISVATSLVTLVGMFYGAKRFDLVRVIIKYGLSRSIGISLSFSIIFFFTSENIIPAFTDSIEIVRLAVLYF